MSAPAWIFWATVISVTLMTVSDGLEAWARIAAERADEKCFEFVKDINCGGGR